jgi:hypothetical protein
MAGNAMSVEILDQVLALYRDPSRVAEVRDRPLPEPMVPVIKVAAGDAGLAAEWAEASAEPAEDISEACVFFLQQILFAPGADAYRVLGSSADAPQARLREHYGLLMRWLHPDRNSDDGWEQVYADRVNQAWQELKTPARRAEYDGRAAEALPVVAAVPMPAARRPVPAGRVAPASGPVLSGGLVRRLPAITLGALGLFAAAVVGVMYWAKHHDEKALAAREQVGEVSAPVASAPVADTRADPEVVVDQNPVGSEAPAPVDEPDSATVAVLTPAPVTAVEPAMSVPVDEEAPAVLAMDPAAQPEPEPEPEPSPVLAQVAAPEPAPVVVPEPVAVPAPAPATPSAPVGAAQSPVPPPAPAPVTASLPSRPASVEPAPPATLAAAPAPAVARPATRPAVTAAPAPPPAAPVSPPPGPVVAATPPPPPPPPRPAPAAAQSAQPAQAVVAGQLPAAAPAPAQAPAVTPPGPRPQSRPASEPTQVPARAAVAAAAPAAAPPAAPAEPKPAAVAEAKPEPVALVEPPSAKEPAPAPVAEPLPAQRAEAVLKELVAAYAAGDSGRFDRLFSDPGALAAMLSLRERLRSSDMRFLQLGPSSWSLGPGQASVRVSYKDTWVPKGERRSQSEAGMLELRVALVGDEVLIAAADMVGSAP